MFSRHAKPRHALTLLGLTLGCGNAAPPPLYPITLRVVSDDRPLPGAAIVIGGRELGATDAQGRFRMETIGVEGTAVEVTVRCPAGFRSPTQPLAVVLRSTVQLDQAQRGQGIETTAQCPPTQRIAAVVVRVPGRPNLPIQYENREITRTDLQGVAHMIFRVGGGDTLRLRIDTHEQPLLRPASPELVVHTNDTDNVYVSTQGFEEAAAPRAPRPRQAPVHVGPQRIPSRRPGGFF
jgi:hypothetical protein